MKTDVNPLAMMFAKQCTDKADDLVEDAIIIAEAYQHTRADGEPLSYCEEHLQSSINHLEEAMGWMSKARDAEAGIGWGHKETDVK